MTVLKVVPIEMPTQATVATPRAAGGLLATVDDPIAHDSSGNGYDGVYSVQGSGPTPRHVPGLVSGNLALHSNEAPPNLAGGNQVRIDHPIIDSRADFTVAWWAKALRVWYSQELYQWEAELVGGGVFVASRFSNSSGDTRPFFRLRGYGFAGDQFTAAGTMMADGLTHFYTVTYDAATRVATFYKDGTVVPWEFPNTLDAQDICESFFIAPALSGEDFIDEFVTLPHAWSSGDVSTFYAAGLAGFTTWNAAILGDGPTAFYHLDDTTEVPVTVSVGSTKGVKVVAVVQYAVGVPTMHVAAQGS